MCHILYADATQLYVSMENHSNMEICCGELHAYILYKTQYALQLAALLTPISA